MAEADRIPTACLAEVEAVYAELDAELSALGYRCRACGRCCDLAAHGFRLYLSTLEAALVLDRAGLEAFPPQRDGRCGFQSGDQCSIHPVRPLGCRTYFCEAEGGHLNELYEKYLKKLRRLAERYGCAWNYAQTYPA